MRLAEGDAQAVSLELVPDARLTIADTGLSAAHFELAAGAAGALSVP